MNLEIRYKPLSTGPQVAFALRIGLLRNPERQGAFQIGETSLYLP